jgi:hypothetical protein
MKGAIGSYVKAASEGVPAARQHLKGVFAEDFQTPGGWTNMLNNMPGGSVTILLGRSGAWWTRECFQALYVACWIHHPVEKGAYMLQLPAAGYANVKDAYNRLLASGALQSRISSHLSKKGASAHEGWDFLKGYGELLVQVEGERAGSPYLYLKCEGHALESGLSLSTILHGASWVKKTLTGSGATASKALNSLAKSSTNVEARAAENFSKQYEKVLDRLGFSGTMTTVEQVIEELARRAGISAGGLPPQIKNNTHLLGRAMQGQQGYIAMFRRQREVLKKNKVKWDDKLEAELTELANRMAATAVAHPQQHYNEVRVTAAELDDSLDIFRQFVR